MSHVIRDLLANLVPDPWRGRTRFSESIRVANEKLWSAVSDEAAAQILGGWLQSEQPCLFGRIAAQRGLITYCFITPDDAAKGDRHVRDRIQDARTRWSAEAY